MKIKLHLEIDIDINTEQELAPVIMRYIVRSFEDYTADLLRGSNSQSTFEIEFWEIKARIDRSHKHIQTHSERITPLAEITAYFSSDGPAVTAVIHSTEKESIPLIMADINAALREAHYKYLKEIREQGDV